MSYGSRLADRYNHFDENTEWDRRIHDDYLTEHLGFAGWMVSGLWKSGGKTAGDNSAPELQKQGGWRGSNKLSESSFWSLENKWLVSYIS